MTKTALLELKAVRSALQFPTVLSHYEIEVAQGQWPQVKILCPFHDDHNPTCGVNSNKHVFHCFACNTGGNILEFVTLMEGGDPKQNSDLQKGARTGLEIMGLEPQEYLYRQGKVTRGRRQTSQKTSAQETEEETPDTTHAPVANKPLGLTLDLNPEHDFFECRGLKREQVEHFGLGYCSRGIMKGRICIPLHDEQGQLVAYAGRHPEDEVPDDVPRYKMPKGFLKSHVLYNLHRLTGHGHKHVVLVEGYWSVMRLSQEGIPSVACLGSSLSDQQVTLLEQAGFRYITVIFDGDDGGRTGAVEAVSKLASVAYVRRIDLADGVKPDTMGREILDRLTTRKT